MNTFDISRLDARKPVLIAGPTASGKSALALRIANKQGGVIVNADAIQVYDGWRVLTARPSEAEERQAPHRLYGHVPFDALYSVGDWQREIVALLKEDVRPIIVGGTGLYFSSITRGLASIPDVKSECRNEGDALRTSGQIEAMLKELDQDTLARIDVQNPMRVQRAWEVQRSTGRGLAAWQDETPPPVLPVEDTHALLLDADKDWLNTRIAQRFAAMIKEGALDEARENLDRYDPELLSCKAIGAPELIAYLQGQMTLDEAREAASIATRQFAKRQRTWFRSKMSSWEKISLPE